MKIFLLLIFLALNSPLQGQKIEKFYDFNHKECPVEKARFYSMKIKTDSGWYREDFYFQDFKLQMKGTYTDSSLKIQNGHFLYAYSNQIIKQTGRYVRGKKEGIWLKYHPNGYLSDSTVYELGKPKGTSLSWHDNGVLRDSSVYEPDGKITDVTWFDNGVLSMAGRYNAAGEEIGLWQYFRKNGKMAAKEIYENGQIKNRIYFTDEGIPKKDTLNKDAEAKYSGEGIISFIKFLEKKLEFPYGYKITNTSQVTLLILFSVDESGVLKVEDHTIPFKAPFDIAVDKLLLKSALWVPCISHNRFVKSYFTLAITFKNYKEE